MKPLKAGPYPQQGVVLSQRQHRSFGAFVAYLNVVLLFLLKSDGQEQIASRIYGES